MWVWPAEVRVSFNKEKNGTCQKRTHAEGMHIKIVNRGGCKRGSVHKTDKQGKCKEHISYKGNSKETHGWSEEHKLLTTHNSERTAIVEPVNNSEWAAPIVPILKPNKWVRLCRDCMLTWPIWPWAPPDSCLSTAKTAKGRTTTKARSTFMGMDQDTKWTLRVCIQGKNETECTHTFQFLTELNVLPKFVHSPVHKLLGKEAKWKWSVEQEDAFKQSKEIN